MAPKKKLTKEAGLTKEKILLGWKRDFGNLIISLPFNKHNAWSAKIMTILVEAEVTKAAPESTIG
jgi:hypothetical protein